MAARDIMPFVSSDGGSPQVHSVLMDATATFNEGDVVVVHANGDVVEGSDEQTTVGVLCGVAAVGSQDVANARTADNLLATAAANGEQIQFWGFTRGAEFITSNVETADTAGPFGEATTADMIGDSGCLRVGSGVWGLCVNGSAANRDFVVTRVLDSQKEDVTKSGNAGVYVVFTRAV
jgi:hypothetical protein